MVVSKRDALAVPLPACLDDADLSTTPGQDTAEARGVVTQAEFYVQSLRLYEITEEVLSAMYASEGRVPSMTKENLSPVERVEQIDFSTVLMLDASLRQWYASLPNKLKVRKNNAEDVKEAVLLRQANLLRLRCVVTHSLDIMTKRNKGIYRSEFCYFGPYFLCCSQRTCVPKHSHQQPPRTGYRFPLRCRALVCVS